MKIIKPLRLGLIQRPYRWQRQHHLGVSVLALADMSANPQLRPDQELWQLAAEELQFSGGVLDFGLPKTHAEFLATGFAWPDPQQRDSHQCVARIQVGELGKALKVSGDRLWQEGRPSKPQPFESIPLDWAHAFGGPAYAENPQGMGFTAEGEASEELPPLPNVERLSQPITAPHDTPVPATFDALALTLPRRTQLMGQQYDDEWQQHEYPGFARDTDWRAFNNADSDQWFEQPELPVGAPWRIENMHPQFPVLEGNLPLWQARCFMQRQRHDGVLFEEITLRGTTVHFFPHRQQMVLIWHGSARISEDDAADVLTLMPALEQRGKSRSPNHYRKVLQQRTESEHAILLSYREKDLLPENAIGAWGDMELPLQHSPMQNNILNRENAVREQQRQRLARQGIDIDELIPVSQKPGPKPDEDLYDYILRQELEAEASHERLASQYDQALERGEGVVPENKDLPGGAENYRRQQQMLHNNRQQLGVSDKKFSQSEQAIYQTYLMSAQHQNAPPRPQEAESLLQRQRAQAIMDDDRDFSGLDFTAADLSGMDLRGADFSTALLENVDFSHSQLDECDFRNAVLVRAELHHTSAKASLFDGANFSLAQCYHSDFSGSSLKDIQLEDAQLEHCIFDNAIISELIINKATLANCRFHQAEIDQCLLMQLKLEGMDFSRATIKQTSFVECHFDRLNLQKTTLLGVTLVTCVAPQANFFAARLTHCAVVSDSQLLAANFSHTQLVECNFRQQMLHQADFSRAILNNCDFSEASLQQAKMLEIKAADCLFIRTDFQGAALTGSSLIGAIMQKSNLTGCDLRGCNLFRADLSQSLTEGGTLFDDAYTEGIKTLPRRDKEQI
ncbi:DUF2169 domain-containing protein [Rouxiella sp. WC2420]|uniref:DUF2169 domain-containing protein n=1 Tax=Rouxiella sp. WC2420 TaxID=3234145 RepID=A0AB39VWC8_9GAMM